MKIIYRATTQDVPFTCWEKSILFGTDYVIKFISDTKKSGDPRYCYVTDSSTYPVRQQIFSIIETTTPTQISNQVKLDISRSWKYTVFEVTPAYIASLTNWTQFSESGLTTVEIGLVKVLDANPTEKEVYTGNQSSFKEYGG